jgi:hypothetical protein
MQWKDVKLFPDPLMGDNLKDKSEPRVTNHLLQTTGKNLDYQHLSALNCPHPFHSSSSRIISR